MTMKVGDTARRSRTVSAEDIELYAQMTGDHNPIHFDAELASRSRFGIEMDRIVVTGHPRVELDVLSADGPGPLRRVADLHRHATCLSSSGQPRPATSSASTNDSSAHH